MLATVGAAAEAGDFALMFLEQAQHACRHRGRPFGHVDDAPKKLQPLFPRPGADAREEFVAGRAVRLRSEIKERLA